MMADMGAIRRLKATKSLGHARHRAGPMQLGPFAIRGKSRLGHYRRTGAVTMVCMWLGWMWCWLIPSMEPKFMSSPHPLSSKTRLALSGLSRLTR